MANGPLGGFMPTPPSPGQPPQVKLETSAESRGAFNKFLGTLPSNGAVAPIQTGVMQSSVTPVSPVTGNVNIFQPQMSQMTAMPMMPPAQPVQMMFNGGEAFGVDDFGDFSSVGDDAPTVDTGFDDGGNNFDEGFTEEEDPGRAGDYQTDESGVFTGTGGDDDPTQIVDTRPRTNIRNVGPTSNLRYDPQFTANLLQQRGLDPQGFMAPADFAQTTQGGASVASANVSASPNLSTGLKTVTNLTGPNQFVDPTKGIAPVTRRSGVTGTGQTGPVDLLGLGDLGFGGLGLGAPNRLQELENIGRKQQQTIRQLTNQLSDAQSEVIPQSIPLAPAPNLTAVDRNLTGISGIGADLSSPQSRDVLDNQFTQLASLRGGIDRLTNLENQARIADADPLAVDVIGAIRSGAAGIPFTNNPGALKQGREDLTTEVVKSLPAGSRLSQDNLAPAIFNTLEAGIGGIDRQLSLYANKPDANITTPAALANTYLGSGNKENSAANRAAYIDAIKNVAGESFDLNNPTTRSNISKAIAKQEFGSAGAQIIDDIRGARTILDDFNLNQLRLNPNITSDVGQLATIDPAIPDENRFADPFTSFDVAESNRARIDREQRAIQDRGGRPVFNLGPGQTGVDIRGPLAARLASVLPDQALETLEGARLPDQVFDIDTRTIQPLSQSAQVQELLNRGARAQEISNIQRALDRGTVAEDLDRPISFVDSDPVADATTTTDLTRGPQVSIVGDDPIAPLETRDIVGDITQQRVADILNNPKIGETFKLGDFEFPNLIATLANRVGSFFDRRLFDGIVKRGLDAVVDPDTGRIIGAKDEFGNLIEGRDLEQFKDEGGDSDPIGTFLKKATEDKEEEKDTTPNVFGGEAPRKTLENVPTVVSSPFQARDINFRPVGFDAGNLNKLIERITGVPSPRGMQDGGQVQAVDRFLSKVA